MYWCPRHVVSSSCCVPVVLVSLSCWCPCRVGVPVVLYPHRVISLSHHVLVTSCPHRVVSLSCCVLVVLCPRRVVSVSSSWLMLCCVSIMLCWCPCRVSCHVVSLSCRVLSLLHHVHVLVVSHVMSMSPSSTWRDVTLSCPIMFPSWCCVVSFLLSG